MGERVHAWIEFAPYDEPVLRRTETGRALCDAIDAYRFDEQETREDEGVSLLHCADEQANYGTSQFDAMNVSGQDFVALAKAAGLWCLLGDEGGIEWDRHHEVHAPDGRSWDFVGSETNRVVLTHEESIQLERATPREALGDAIDTHFILGRRSLGLWVASEEVETLGR